MSKAKKPRTKARNTTLAVAMIARNEARCITRCLESVRPWVDKMIVLDTGSSDDTRELARKAGAIVHEMPWPDSFSEARNRSLELADADWNLIIDADEWIKIGGKKLRRWCDASTSNRLGAVCVHSSCLIPRGNSEEKVATDNVNWMARVLPRGVKFERRVHEQVASPFPLEKIELHLGHDGYLEQQLQPKRGRNYGLLLLDLGDRPGDPYILYQLGKESEGFKEYGSACNFYQQALAATPEGANWQHGLVIRYLYCLGQTGNFQTAMTYMTEHVQRWQHSPDFFFAAGNIALEQAKADPANALSEWLPLAVTAWERCLEIGDQPGLEESWHGVGSFLAQNNLNAVRSQLALIAA